MQNSFRTFHADATVRDMVHQIAKRLFDIKFKLKRLFDKHDKDGNGTLEIQELNQAVRSAGFALQPEQLQQMFAAFKFKPSGGLEFCEFAHGFGKFAHAEDDTQQYQREEIAKELDWEEEAKETEAMTKLNEALQQKVEELMKSNGDLQDKETETVTKVQQQDAELIKLKADLKKEEQKRKTLASLNWGSKESHVTALQKELAKLQNQLKERDTVYAKGMSDFLSSLQNLQQKSEEERKAYNTKYADNVGFMRTFDKDNNEFLNSMEISSYCKAEKGMATQYEPAVVDTIMMAVGRKPEGVPLYNCGLLYEGLLSEKERQQERQKEHEDALKLVETDETEEKKETHVQLQVKICGAAVGAIISVFGVLCISTVAMMPTLWKCAVSCVAGFVQGASAAEEFDKLLFQDSSKETVRILGMSLHRNSTQRLAMRFVGAIVVGCIMGGIVNMVGLSWGQDFIPTRGQNEL